MVEEVMDLDYSNSQFIEMIMPRHSKRIAGASFCGHFDEVPKRPASSGPDFSTLLRSGKVVAALLNVGTLWELFGKANASGVSPEAFLEVRSGIEPL